MYKLSRYTIETGYRRKLEGVHSIIRNSLALLTGIYMIAAAYIYPEPTLQDRKSVV